MTKGYDSLLDIVITEDNESEYFKFLEKLPLDIDLQQAKILWHTGKWRCEL